MENGYRKTYNDFIDVVKDFRWTLVKVYYWMEIDPVENVIYRGLKKMDLIEFDAK